MGKYSTILRIIFIAIAAAMVAGCSFGAVIGSGRSVTETREVSDFSAVEFAFMGDLTIEQGDEESLTITGDDNIVELIRTSVNDGVLRIDAAGATVGRTVVPLRYTLTVKDLRGLSLSGLGSVEMSDLNSDRMALSLSGAGSVRIDNLQANDLAVNMSGLGDINVAGEVNEQAVTVSGAGSYFARNLQSDVAAVSLTGLGSAEVNAVEELSANISGAGSIRYAGTPQVSQQVSGLGSVEALEAD